MSVVNVDGRPLLNHPCTNSWCWNFEEVLHIFWQSPVTTVKLLPLVLNEIKLPEVICLITSDVTTKDIEGVGFCTVVVCIVISHGAATVLGNSVSRPLARTEVKNSEVNVGVVGVSTKQVHFLLSDKARVMRDGRWNDLSLVTHLLPLDVVADSVLCSLLVYHIFDV
jgi:hypothetical protein